MDPTEEEKAKLAEEAKEAEEKKAAEEEAAKKKPPTGDDTGYDVVIGGVKKTLTLEELRTAASKSLGADAKFDDAAKQRKEAAEGLRIAELLNRLKTKGEGAESADIQEFLTLLGIDPAEATKLMETAKKKESATKKDEKKGEESSTVTMEQLDPQIQAAIKAAERLDVDQMRKKIEDDIRKGVDTDSILSKMVSEVPEEVQAELRTTLYDMVMASVRGRILAGEGFGPEMISTTLQTVRAWVKRFGTPAKGAGQLPVVGFGPSGTTFSAEVLAPEPIQRVPSTDPNYEETAVKRFQQKFLQVARKLGKK